MTAFRFRPVRRLPEMLADRGGNFAAITALLLPVLLGVVGVSVDHMRLSQERNRMQNAADAAALAAASALADKGITEDEAKALALDFLRGQMAAVGSLDPKAGEQQNADAPFSEKPRIVITPEATPGNGKKFTVEITAHKTVTLTGMSKILGLEDRQIEAFTKVASQTATMSALSMYLVLDKSGSMAWVTETKDAARSACANYTESNWKYYPKLAATSPCYIDKITALKTAVKSLTAQLDTADPKSEYSRLGAVSYNSATQTPSPLAWGTASSLTYVNALVAEGGTASTGGMQKAYDSLMDAKETKAHVDKTGLTPAKFIVFMTDGDNNNTVDDTKTEAICEKARADKITIYTVAFMAPARGQTLLKNCAGVTTNYFEAATMSDLVSAFKTIGRNASTRATRLTD